MKNHFFRAASIAALVVFASFTAGALTGAEVDLSGTWVFSVDLEDGGHGDPTFVFKQAAGKLTGTYEGPMGKRDVAGTVTEKTAVFGFEFDNEGQKVKATYTGTIESATKMSGTVEFTVVDGVRKGKWTANKK
jgi:hypothetical protein